ncbi:MAG: RNHCP domain-containing protein [Lentisphaerota bacterium]
MTRMSGPELLREAQEPAFMCGHCHRMIPGAAPGTEHRNHCPWCLWSLHVDLRTGDRRSSCRGEMEPVAVCVQRNGEWSMVHRCRKCGWVRLNRIAGDDNEWLLMSMALRPLAQPPFPLDRLAWGEDKPAET